MTDSANPPEGDNELAASPGKSGPRIRTVIVDDHQMFAESIARLLASEPDMEVAGVALTSARGIELCAELKPEVALVDFVLPDGDGTDAAAAIVGVSPDTQILMLTGLDDDRLLLAAIDAGCAGFLTKDKAFSELAHAIRLVSQKEAYIPPVMLARLLPRFGRSDEGKGTQLSTREREVLTLIRDGQSNQAIADHLVLSVHTVRNHVQNILGKLGAHSRLEAVAIAVRQGILER